MWNRFLVQKLSTACWGLSHNPNTPASASPVLLLSLSWLMFTASQELEKHQLWSKHLWRKHLSPKNNFSSFPTMEMVKKNCRATSYGAGFHYFLEAISVRTRAFSHHFGCDIPMIGTRDNLWAPDSGVFAEIKSPCGNGSSGTWRRDCAASKKGCDGPSVVVLRLQLGMRWWFVKLCFIQTCFLYFPSKYGPKDRCHIKDTMRNKYY